MNYREEIQYDNLPIGRIAWHLHSDIRTIVGAIENKVMKVSAIQRMTVSMEEQ
jgi:hypothetical protein